MKRTLFIGDVHGCYEEMMQIIEQFHYTPGEDSIYFTGDLINKGPNSLKAVETVQKNAFKSVLGNHEDWLLNWIQTPQELWTEKQKRSAELLEDPIRIAEIVKEWPLWIDTSNALLVHAGIEPGKKNLDDMNKNTILTIRTWDGCGENLNNPEDPAWFECVSWPKTIVFGHWAKMGLVQKPGFCGLDSGCVYGKFLSAFCPEENKLYSVPAKKVYSPIKKK